ncbi:MAG: homoserine dehydrogenase [Kurthia sp.]|nr:homoserine dehydrogenase [Candidatus Kurthia equi]
MTSVKVAILGFGTVGEGIFNILQEKREQFKTQLGIDLDVAKILVRDATKQRVGIANTLLTESIDEVLAVPNLDVVFEAIVGEEPAYGYLDKAIEHHVNVVTANKVMFAKFGQVLQEKAQKYGVQVGYEATTAGGVPVIKTMENILRVNDVNHVQGILNGTSNYILTQMRTEGISFETALKNAQQLGYAEADPYNDVSGQDAFKKLMILSNLAFGQQPNWDDVEVVGISAITLQQVQEADAKGQRYRHIAEVGLDEDGYIFAKIGPQLVDATHPLYSIDGVDNAVSLDTNYIGKLTLVGPGAGMYPTASVMVEDYADMLVKKPALVTI